MTEDQLSLASWIAGVIGRWRLIVAAAALVLVLAMALSLFATPAYRSRATFVAAGGNMRLPANLAGFAAQLGVTPGADPEESPEFYSGLLMSRELLTRAVTASFPDARTAPAGDSATLIDLFGVRARSEARRVEVATKALSQRLDVTADRRTNLVTVTVDAEWPELSAAIANRLVALVSAFNVQHRQSRARARREFIESRVRGAQLELRENEDRLPSFYEANRQWEQSPGLRVEEARLRRQVEVANEVYLSLRREYETARIDEVNNTPVITVVDTAVAPTRRHWPRYKLLFVTGGIAGIVLGFSVAGIAELHRFWANQHPAQARQLREAVTGVAGQVRGTFGSALARRRRDGTDA